MLVAPSMLSADFGHLSEGIALIENSKADWYHLDIMDGYLSQIFLMAFQ